MRRFSRISLIKMILLVAGGLLILNYNNYYNFTSELIIEDEPVKRELLSQEEEIHLPIPTSIQGFDIKNMIEHPKNPSIDKKETIDLIDEDKVNIQNHHKKEDKKEEQVRIPFYSEPIGAEEQIATRMENINELCNSDSMKMHRKDSTHRILGRRSLYFFKDFGPKGITWCPVFKAGSSTWRDFFIDHLVDPDATVGNEHYNLSLLSKFTLSQLLRQLRKSKNHKSKDHKSISKDLVVDETEVNNSILFTIVRHPVSRLISYLHKVQNYPFAMKRQRLTWTEDAIVSARTNSSWDDETKKKYRTELTTYVDELEPLVDHAPFSKDNPYLHPPHPTFVELVDFIIKHNTGGKGDKKGRNGHWLPAVEWCDICRNEYDIIIKLEEEPDELMVLLEKLDMLQYKESFMKRHNSSSNKSISEKELIEQYVNLLNEQQREFLNKMFAKDFRFFGYEKIPL
ncbi:uncharacterized protein LOC134812885 [Bolinopsis microptera]|uniref:uncharacterized protein LOC134812885 n=1 Tax=Bolinopsis microptera TaxID=2820187 RepID=UPI00307AF0C0